MLYNCGAVVWESALQCWKHGKCVRGTWKEQVSSLVRWRLGGRDVTSENVCCKNWCENRVVMPYTAQQPELCLTAPCSWHWESDLAVPRRLNSTSNLWINMGFNMDNLIMLQQSNLRRAILSSSFRLKCWLIDLVETQCYSTDSHQNTHQFNTSKHDCNFKFW